jgi:hypothetical protein
MSLRPWRVQNFPVVVELLVSVCFVNEASESRGSDDSAENEGSDGFGYIFHFKSPVFSKVSGLTLASNSWVA